MKSLRFCNKSGIELATLFDGAVGKDQNPRKLKRLSLRSAGFSLVEVTLALGVAAICLLPLMALLPVASKTQQTSIQQTMANQIISQISSILRADVRLPPGLYNKVCPDPPDPNEVCNWDALHGHWRDVADPDTMYFTNEGKQTGNIGPNASPPADAVFRAKITYRRPPAETTSLADIAVSWPAAVDPDPPNNGVPAGSVVTSIAVNR
jgi:type II secretory pathway pseudopilin PulG